MLNAEVFKAVIACNGQHICEGYRAIKILFWVCWDLYVDATSALLSAEIDTLLRPCGNNTNTHTKISKKD